jgi:hypothetical protein
MVEALPRGDQLPIGADRQGLDRPRKVREDAFPAGLNVPEPNLAALGVDAPVPGNPGPRGDPSSVGADRQAPDVLDVAAVGALQVAESVEVLPLPAAKVGRAAFEQVLGISDIVCRPRGPLTRLM